MLPLVQKKDDILLHVRLTPKADKEEIFGIDQDEYGQQYLKIRVRAVPEKGKANKALISLIAKKAHIPKSLISVMNGETQRRKILRIALPFNEVQLRFKSILNLKEG